VPKPIRVRFAPSPTGFLHVGGARTALFNWLYARSTGGTFVLRIEDTDRQRSTAEHTQVILDGLTWLGLDWDEGPLFQGANADQHRSDVSRLVESATAYRCFCTPETLDQLRSAAKSSGSAFHYDRRCDRLPREEVTARVNAGEPFTVRFRVPDGEVAWEDAVHGRIAFQGRELDDFIIQRADGSAIYNMAVVSDDIAMRITHVIRGDDHISNTPKQILLYQALGASLPVFAHVPMILGADGKKLSKRHGATAVGDYQSLGILPVAMRNFLALLGWSPGEDLEILGPEELIGRFSLDGIQKKPAVFDTTKLEWMNGQYISAMTAPELSGEVSMALAGLGVTVPSERLGTLIEATKTRSRTITHLAEQIAVRVDDSRIVLDTKGEKLIQKMGAGFASSLSLAVEILQTIPEGDWTTERILEEFHTGAEAYSVKLGDLMQPVRVALTGSTVSEPVNELLLVVGREASLKRILAALDRASG
jgi:glutamyl-tRNA synthetase